MCYGAAFSQGRLRIALRCGRVGSVPAQCYTPGRDFWRQKTMRKASRLYRIAAVLILLFDIGHTTGYPWSDPNWRVDLSLVRSSHFDIFGSSRTYWDFYLGFGLFVTVFLLLAAILAWQLGGLPNEALLRMRATAWTFGLCFGGVAVLSWKYFFIIPIVFSILITLCLTVAAWRLEKAT